MKLKHEHDLVKVAPKEVSDYDGASLPALVAYSLYWLHQWDFRRSIEAITILSWKLFPSKFSMVGWPEYPDKERINRSLLQGGPKYRNWLTGAASKGFSLNDRGIQIAVELTQSLGPPFFAEGRSITNAISSEFLGKKSQPRTIEPEREVAKAKDSRLFEKWKEGIMSERDLIHVHTMLEIFEHTPQSMREKRMQDLERAANDSNDTEVEMFLSEVRSNFPSVFGRTKRR